VDEIKKYFKTALRNKVVPKPAEILQAIQKSKDEGGELHKRSKDIIKKKIWNFIRK
jgi:hypothetical protein